MPTTNENLEVSLGADSIVIRQYVSGILGGKVLDTTNFTPEVIKAGHIVIRDIENDVYKPMPLNAEGTAYASLPIGHEYVGVVVATKLTKEPQVGIMYAGEVNDVASPYPINTIKSAVLAAVPTLVFKHD